MKKIFLMAIFLAAAINQPNELFSMSHYAKSYGRVKVEQKPTRIIKVPAEFSSIQGAVKVAKDGDWIIVSPGKYHEKNIQVNKSVTISSEWKLTDDRTKIDETIIDSDDKRLFIITADGVEISGLHIINGDHSLDISSKVTIMHNRFVNNLDAMSFEGSSGGYVGYNIVENDRDDGLDIDIRFGGSHRGSNILVEHNTIINSNDDGIEIRLYAYPEQNINYIIRENTIIGSKNAGIQIISYDIFTGKTFQIHHNVIRDCKTGLGCMEGARTAEDLSGASKMDELIWFFNNTLINNQMGATGGNSIIAVNNLVQGNFLGGFKRFGRNSEIINNLFYLNGDDDFVDVHEAVKREGNIFSIDPLIDKSSFMPLSNSPCIDVGKERRYKDGVCLLEVSSKYIHGSAPDIGAIEYGKEDIATMVDLKLIVDAGKDMILVSPENEIELQGRITANPGTINSYWRLEKGPGKVEIITPDKIQTKVMFNIHGEYQFSFIGSNEKHIASDNLTVRYINDGNGKELFLKEKINIIGAENYSYSYGNISVVESSDLSENRYVVMDKKNIGHRPTLEYSVGSSEDADFAIWLLLQNKASKKSSLQINFNNQEMDCSVYGKKWKWIKIHKNASMTAGLWPLKVGLNDGSVSIAKIILSSDPKFNPK